MLLAHLQLPDDCIARAFGLRTVMAHGLVFYHTDGLSFGHTPSCTDHVQHSVSFFCPSLIGAPTDLYRSCAVLKKI